MSLGLWLYYSYLPKVYSEKYLDNAMYYIYTLEGDSLVDLCDNFIDDSYMRYMDGYPIINIPNFVCRSRVNDIIMNKKDSAITERSKWLKYSAFLKLEELGLSGNTHAYAVLGRLFDTDDNDFCKEIKNEEKSAFWSLKAAETNEPFSQYRIAQFYRYGIGVVDNMGKALYWLRKVAFTMEHEERNWATVSINGKAHRIIGNLFSTGCPPYLEQNMDSAMYYWKVGAELGDSDAKERLQRIYE